MVDRLGVETLQSVELTSTNKPRGLTNPYLTLQVNFYPRCWNREQSSKHVTEYANQVFPGDDIEEAIPDPIPNSEVKLFGADGTAWATVWESRSLPGFIFFYFVVSIKM